MFWKFLSGSFFQIRRFSEKNIIQRNKRGVIAITIGKRIRYYRQRNGITQWQLSRAIQVTPGTVLLIERGEKQCPAELLEAIASALGVSEADLYGNNFEEE